MQKPILTGLILLLGTVNLFANDELTKEVFEDLHPKLTQTSEAWQTIPWRTNLLDARTEAHQQRKLIFIWSMDGHPLGCT